jgi:hypothetical protein
MPDPWNFQGGVDGFHLSQVAYCVAGEQRQSTMPFTGLGFLVSNFSGQHISVSLRIMKAVVDPLLQLEESRGIG